jgi:hypothetical protein
MKNRKKDKILLIITIIIIFSFPALFIYINKQWKQEAENKVYQRNYLKEHGYKASDCFIPNDEVMPEGYEFFNKIGFSSFRICEYHYETKSKEDFISIATYGKNLDYMLNRITPSKSKIHVVKKFNYLGQHGAIATDCRDLRNCQYYLLYEQNNKTLEIITSVVSSEEELMDLMKKIISLNSTSAPTQP